MGDAIGKYGLDLLQSDNYLMYLVHCDAQHHTIWWKESENRCTTDVGDSLKNAKKRKLMKYFFKRSNTLDSLVDLDMNLNCIADLCVDFCMGFTDLSQVFLMPILLDICVNHLHN